MNRNIACFAGAAALTSPFIAISLIALSLVAAPQSASADPVGPTPVKIIPGFLSIDSFGVARPRGVLSAHGIISTTSPKPLTVTYIISKRQGQGWDRLKTGQVVVSPGKPADVFASIQQVKHEQTFQLEAVVQGVDVSRSKVFSLASSSKFVVRYDTSGNRSDGHWVLVAVYNDENSGLNNVDKLADKMKATMKTFNFQTEIRMKSTQTFIVKNSYRKSVFIRTSEPIERDFGTKKEAVAFHDKLRKLVPSPQLTVEDVHEQPIGKP
jgi:hypothetical protein